MIGQVTVTYQGVTIDYDSITVSFGDWMNLVLLRVSPLQIKAIRVLLDDSKAGEIELRFPTVVGSRLKTAPSNHVMILQNMKVFFSDSLIRFANYHLSLGDRMA